ncbi:hypothetical protein HD806DRAFT_503263 [Xylariaceae sp. AK1471]|nr:hypothetical protein HD806DRAFT_503263 [Xylariaceae sp. AK1471]
MESRSGLRRRERGSTLSSADQHQHDVSESESSDEDDNGIPAIKLPSVSPAKRLSISSSTCSHANRVKRSLTDTDRGNIIFYPRSKRQKNGFNMAPVPRPPFPVSNPNSLHASKATIGTDQTTSRIESLSVTPEDYVSEGLVSSVNDALRNLQTLYAKDYIEQRLQQAEDPTSPLMNKARSAELNECENEVSDQGSALPLAVPAPTISYIPPVNSNASNGIVGEVQETNQAPARGTMLAEDEERTDAAPPPRVQVKGAPDREDQAEAEAQAPVDIASRQTDDVWEVQTSPGPPSLRGGNHDNGLGFSQRPQAAKKRGRPSKPSRISNKQGSLPNDAPIAEKRKVGRPKKNYPRFRGEMDKDYIIRIARLQKRPVPRLQDQDAYSTLQSSAVPNDPPEVQLDTADESVQVADDSAHTSAYVSGAIQAQVPKISPRQSRRTFSDSDGSQIAEKLDDQLKPEPEEDVARLANYTELDVRDGDYNEGHRGFIHSEELAQYEPVDEHDEHDGRDGHGRADPGVKEDDDAHSEFIPGFDADLEGGEDVEIQSDFIDESDTDLNGDENVDLPAEDSFMRDVDEFNSRQPLYAYDDDVFEGPYVDDIIAIHLDHEPLRQVCKLLSDLSWAGVKGDWQWRHFAYDDAETAPARALLRMLVKLERLYQASPRAPNLEEQNRFLSEHANMLRYYFHKIKLIVEHIRTQRLEIIEHNAAAQNTNPRKRKRMTRDLVLYVIPMMTHVLASAWGLGGETWFKTSFTSATVELLERALGWVMALHRHLLRELERCPLEENPKTQYQLQSLRKRNAKRKEIGPLLDDLHQVIAAAPDRLAETEVRVKKEFEQRQQQLKREKQLKAQQKLAGEARLASIAERKKRSLLSIHGIHYPLGSSTASSRPSPSPTSRSTEWSLEEQRFLFKKIQDSFPEPPDLNYLRWELNKTVAETAAMTKQILGKMLAAVKPDQSPDERAAEVRRIMQRSKVI